MTEKEETFVNVKTIFHHNELFSSDLQTFQIKSGRNFLTKLRT